MAMLPDVFKSDNTEPMQDFEPAPADWYLCEIIKSEVKPTKAKTGKRLNFQVSIIDGGERNDDGDPKYKGKPFFIGLNVQNPSKQAVEISLRELKSICTAVGFDGDLEDTVDLHDIAFGVKLGIETSEGYAPKNVAKKYVTEAEYNELMEE